MSSSTVKTPCMRSLDPSDKDFKAGRIGVRVKNSGSRSVNDDEA